jgi:hypothetical protein
MMSNRRSTVSCIFTSVCGSPTSVHSLAQGIGAESPADRTVLKLPLTGIMLQLQSNLESACSMTCQARPSSFGILVAQDNAVKDIAKRTVFMLTLPGSMPQLAPGQKRTHVAYATSS